MAQYVAELNDFQFEEEVINSEMPVLVDFSAPWSQPCKQMAPVLEEVAREYQGRVRVVRINTDDFQATAARYSVRVLPTLLLFKEGQPKVESRGFLLKHEMKKMLDSLVSKTN